MTEVFSVICWWPNSISCEHNDKKKKKKKVNQAKQFHNQGAWTLSMISYGSAKMTSTYPTSCLDLRRKHKVNKPIFKGCPRKNTCKYQHFNHIVFSCSACLQKENRLSDKYAIIVRCAVYKAWSLHKGKLTLHDAIVSHLQNGRI